MNNKLSEIQQTIEELLQLLEKYNDGEINYQVNELKKGLDWIESDLNETVKILKISEIQKNIYPARGGLSDFYVWKENEQE